MTTTTIRAAHHTDLADVARIYAHYVAHTLITFDEEAPALDEWATKLAAAEASGWPFLVAVDEEGAVLGYALLAPFRGKSGWRFAAENSIYLDPAATGRGLGKLLLERLTVAGTAAGARSIIAVITDEGTEASVALHTKAGFAPAGALPQVGWKFGRSVGVTMMVKYLSAV